MAAPAARGEREPDVATSMSGVSMAFGRPGSDDLVRAPDDVSPEIGRREPVSLIGPGQVRHNLREVDQHEG